MIDREGFVLKFQFVDCRNCSDNLSEELSNFSILLSLSHFYIKHTAFLQHRQDRIRRASHRRTVQANHRYLL